jgi:hypothetical protein
VRGAQARLGVTMATLPPRRALVCPALLLSFLSLACNNPPPTTTPDLPQVTLAVAEPNAVGSSFKLSISVSGCDQVQSLEVLDNNVLVKQVPYAGTPTAVELAIGELRFPRSITIDLSLAARVTCADGRTNVSQTQSATFFPVEEIVEPDSVNEQVLPDFFVADGSGASTSFIGCSKEGNLSYLYRVKRSDPLHPDKMLMPFECTVDTTITDRKPAGTGWRWVWTPGKGAFAIDSTFSKPLAYTGDKRVAYVTVDPSGNAFLAENQTLQRWSPAGSELWFKDFSMEGTLIGEPFLRPDQKTVVLPLLGAVEAGNIYVTVDVLNYVDGTKGTYNIDKFPISAPPPVAFDSTGTVLYLSTQGASAANVRACAIGKTSLCRPGTDAWLWTTNDLAGRMAALLPYNNGSRLAAITTNRFWFLDVKNVQGTTAPLINKDQQPLASSGSLVSNTVLAGPGTSSAFYMFNSAAPTDSNPHPYPVELIVTDGVEKGELYRYQVPGGSVTGALDDSGTLWLRIGPRLVKPYALSWYRERR